VTSGSLQRQGKRRRGESTSLGRPGEGIEELEEKKDMNPRNLPTRSATETVGCLKEVSAKNSHSDKKGERVLKLRAGKERTQKRFVLKQAREEKKKGEECGCP